LRVEELHNILSSLNIINVIKLKRMRWVGYVTLMGSLEIFENILVGEPEGKRPHRRPWA